jgi:hypothetical protein
MSRRAKKPAPLPKPPPLEWTLRPAVEENKILGKRHRWRSKDKRYVIHKTLGYGNTKLLAEVVTADGRLELLGSSTSLQVCKNICEVHASKQERT